MVHLDLGSTAERLLVRFRNEFIGEWLTVKTASNKDAGTAGNYYKGMATFTVTKGGLMAGVSIGGQKFSYKPV